MKLVSLKSVALAAALVLPGALQAQEVLHYEGIKTAGGDVVGSAQTGAYIASRSPFGALNRFDIYCIDYDNSAQTSWTARYVTFAQATNVGSAENLAAIRQLGSGVTLANFRAAAYLSTQFGAGGLGGAAVVGAGNDNWDDVHGAIWSMFSGNANVTPYNMTYSAQRTAAGTNASWDSYVLVLDDRAFTAGYTGTYSQAFITEGGNTTITSAPEPSTYVLMGAGLLAVGFVRRRRRSV